MIKNIHKVGIEETYMTAHSSVVKKTWKDGL